MNIAPLPHIHADAATNLTSAAELAGDAGGDLLRNDGTAIELRFDDACRYVGVSMSTVEKVWAALADQLAAPGVPRECLWPNRLIGERAGVSTSQARRSLRVLAAFGLLDRQRRFNTSSVTGVSPEVASRADLPAREHARCDADGCEGCDLGDVQAALAPLFGAQVWGASWASDLSAAMGSGWGASGLVHEITSNMASVDAPENHVRVARARLQYLIGKRGERHRPQQPETSPSRADSLPARPARADSTRVHRADASPRHAEPLSSGGIRETGRAGPGRIGSGQRAPTKQPKQVIQDQPKRASDPQMRAASRAVRRSASATQIQVTESQERRWATAVIALGLSPVDVRWGVFGGLSNADSPHAVISWRLTDSEGMGSITVHADRHRQRRRARAQQRLLRLRRLAAEHETTVRVEQDKAHLSESRSRNEAHLAGLLGEAPAAPVRALARMLPALEIEFADGRMTEGLLLRRVREALTNKDHVVARQAARLVSEPLAEHILGGKTVRVISEPDAAPAEDGRLFSME